MPIVPCTLWSLVITDVRGISLSDICPYFLLPLFSERYTEYKSKHYRLCNIYWLKDNTIVCWSDCSSSEHWHTFFCKLLYHACCYVPLCNSLLCVKTWCRYGVVHVDCICCYANTTSIPHSNSNQRQFV